MTTFASKSTTKTMGISKLSTRKQRLKVRSKQRTLTIKQLSARPVIRNIDVASIAADFEANAVAKKPKQAPTPSSLKEAASDGKPRVAEPKKSAPTAKKAVASAQSTKPAKELKRATAKKRATTTQKKTSVSDRRSAPKKKDDTSTSSTKA